MADINKYAAGSGRKIKEDNSIVNLADKIDEIHKALVINKNAGVTVSNFPEIEIKNDTGNPLTVKLSGNTMEYFGLSTDAKPTTGLVKGATFFEIDKTIVNMWDGTKWVVI